MLRVNLPYLEIECDATIDEKGVNIDMKKFNINNFNIDKVFKWVDKKCGKKEEQDNSMFESEEKTDDYYTIKIE